MPFSETILNGRELGQLSSPIWENTKGFGLYRSQHKAHWTLLEVSPYIAVLIIVARVASVHLVCHIVANWITSFQPEARVVTCLVVGIIKFKIPVSSLALPDYLVFVQCERSGFVEVTFEAEQVTESSECVVEYHVHTTSMYFIDGFLPFSNVAKMVVQDSEVERRVGIVGPWLVDKG